MQIDRNPATKELRETALMHEIFRSRRADVRDGQMIDVECPVHCGVIDGGCLDY